MTHLLFLLIFVEGDLRVARLRSPSSRCLTWCSLMVAAAGSVVCWDVGGLARHLSVRETSPHDCSVLPHSTAA